MGRITKAHYHEVADRISIIENTINSFVYKHPAIKNKKKYRKLAMKSMKALAELYQLTGARM